MDTKPETPVERLAALELLLLEQARVDIDARPLLDAVAQARELRRAYEAEAEPKDAPEKSFFASDYVPRHWYAEAVDQRVEAVAQRDAYRAAYRAALDSAVAQSDGSDSAEALRRAVEEAIELCDDGESSAFEVAAGLREALKR